MSSCENLGVQEYKDVLCKAYLLMRKALLDLATEHDFCPCIVQSALDCIYAEFAVNLSLEEDEIDECLCEIKKVYNYLVLAKG